jgi:hypothetical protein
MLPERGVHGVARFVLARAHEREDAIVPERESDVDLKSSNTDHCDGFGFLGKAK